MPDATFIFPDEFRQGRSGVADFTFVDAMSTDRLPSDSQELYLNTDSMQEMSKVAIENYFGLMRRTLTGPRFFYQNNRESKRMDEEVIKPAEFPYREEDRHLFFTENRFMRYHIVMRKKWGIPYLIPVRRSHVRSMTSLVI